MLAVLRRFVTSFYDTVAARLPQAGRSSAWASRLSLAAHELVENAVAYGPHADATFTIRIDPVPEEAGGAHRVRMTTRNRAEPEQRETVRQRVEDLKHTDDPFAYYVELMSESVRRNEGSGLGLARVRAEADMEIDCVIEGDHLEVAAEVRIPSDTSGDGPDDPTP